jgi:hypothetical protein
MQSRPHRGSRSVGNPWEAAAIPGLLMKGGPEQDTVTASNEFPLYLAVVSKASEHCCRLLGSWGRYGYLVKATKHIPMSILKRGSSKFWYIQFQFQRKTYIKS